VIELDAAVIERRGGRDISGVRLRPSIKIRGDEIVKNELYLVQWWGRTVLVDISSSVEI
jgi:hypothetical protein